MFIKKSVEKVVFRTKQAVRCFSSIDSLKENPVVTVKQGKLKGAVKKCLDGSPYYSFKGIRYGQPPVGELRFKDVNELLQYLRSVPARELTKLAIETRTQDEKLRGLPMYYAPMIEKKFEGQEQFLTEDPLDLILAGKVSKVPLLIGYNSAEGILMANDHIKKLEIFNKDPSYLVTRDLARTMSKEKLVEFGHRIKQFYFGGKDATKVDTQAIINVQTDINFMYQTHRFLNFFQRMAPVFLYNFDYETDLNIVKNMIGLNNVKGACHADDLFYLFHSKMSLKIIEGNDTLKKIVYQITKFWADFAKSGNPTPTTGSIEWRPYTPATKEYLLLNQDMKLSNNLDKERVEFWDKIYADAGKPCIAMSSL